MNPYKVALIKATCHGYISWHEIPCNVSRIWCQPLKHIICWHVIICNVYKTGIMQNVAVASLRWGLMQFNRSLMTGNETCHCYVSWHEISCNVTWILRQVIKYITAYVIKHLIICSVTWNWRQAMQTLFLIVLSLLKTKMNEYFKIAKFVLHRRKIY